MRRSDNSQMEDLGDLDFSINLNGPVKDSNTLTNADESGFQTQTGWVPLSSTAEEETKRDDFNRNFATPEAVSMSSDQFRHLHEEGLVDTLFSTALNPVACLFHLAFKGGAMFCFLFLNAIIHEEILTFIVVVILAAMDFWTVKNVTGRLLVNLRWDSHIDQFGNEIMVYETDESRKHQQAQALAGDVEAQQRLEREERVKVGATDSKIFWMGTYGAPLMWAILWMKQIWNFSFLWMVTASVCFSLSLTNAQGFYHCQRSHTQKLTQYIQEKGLAVFRSATKSSLMPSFLSNISLPSFMRRGGNGGDSGSAGLM